MVGVESALTKPKMITSVQLFVDDEVNVVKFAHVYSHKKLSI